MINILGGGIFVGNPAPPPPGPVPYIVRYNCYGFSDAVISFCEQKQLNFDGF